MGVERRCPIRTCCVCRLKAEKKSLLRFVLENGQPVADESHRKNGRGAYCCRAEKCGMTFVQQSKRWKRAFRVGEQGTGVVVVQGCSGEANRR